MFKLVAPPVPLARVSALPLSLAPLRPLHYSLFRTFTSSYDIEPWYSRTIEGLSVLFDSSFLTSQKLVDARPTVR